jgi:1-acyl-sn-glycerol-3-phosphate acyltransferase
MVGEMPDLPKFVIVAAPHKTNWDLPNALAAGLHYGIAIKWMGKDSLFKWPFGGLMRWLGGIAIDRSKRNNAVTQMIETFNGSDHLVLVIPPEGTRSDVTQWKSGFYHIAHGAKVPLVLAFIDYNRREIGVADVFTPTGDYERDLAIIQSVYAPKMPTAIAKAA